MPALPPHSSPPPAWSTAPHWVCDPHSFLCFLTNTRTHIQSFLFLLESQDTYLAGCAFARELSPGAFSMPTSRPLYWPNIYTCIVVKVVSSITSHLLSANLTMLDSSKTHIGTDNIEKVPVIQATAKKHNADQAK